MTDTTVILNHLGIPNTSTTPNPWAIARLLPSDTREYYRLPGEKQEEL